MKKIRVSLFALTAALTAMTGLAAVAGVRFATSYLPFGHERDVQPVTELPEIPNSSVPVFAEPIIVGLSGDGTSSIEQTDLFDPTGTYYIHDQGLPPAFADISHFDIEVREYYQDNNEWKSRPVVPKGSLQGKRFHSLTRFAVGNGEIAFQTSTVEGVSYRFTGTFPNAGDYCEYDGGSPDLVGQLIKIRDGKWAAESEVKFSLYCGC